MSSTQFQHVVLMRFPEPLDEASEAWMTSVIEGWSQTIGTLVECRVGADLTGERSQGWHYLLYTVFADREAFEGYVVHPAHQELVTFLNDRSCERLAFDYYF
jgi:hypothetical protein